MQKIEKTAMIDMRLDVLVSLEGDASRSQAARWIAEGLCEVNGKTVLKAGFSVKPGDRVVFTVPDAVESTVEKENMVQAVMTMLE